MQNLNDYLKSLGLKLVNGNAIKRANYLLRFNKSELQIEALYQNVTVTAGTKVEIVAELLLNSNYLVEA